MKTKETLTVFAVVENKKDHLFSKVCKFTCISPEDSRCAVAFASIAVRQDLQFFEVVNKARGVILTPNKGKHLYLCEKKGAPWKTIELRYCAPTFYKAEYKSIKRFFSETNQFVELIK